MAATEFSRRAFLQSSAAAVGAAASARPPRAHGARALPQVQTPGRQGRAAYQDQGLRAAEPSDNARALLHVH